MQVVKKNIKNYRYIQNNNATFAICSVNKAKQ